MAGDIITRVQKPLSDNELWAADSVPKPWSKDTCPKTYKPCVDWDEKACRCLATGGPFMCLAVGRCLQEKK